MLNAFFDANLRYHQAGHVLLFETKPVCIIPIWLKAPNRRYTDINWIKGWKTFKKYEHLFPHPNFIFNLEIQEKVAHLFLINKYALKKCLQENLCIFQEFIGVDFSPDQFITQLEHGVALPHLIGNNTQLLGIILGYGQESSKAYTEARKLSQIPDWTDSYCPVETKRPAGCKIFPISFMGNPHSPEVAQLVAQYDLELEAIWQLYLESGDHLQMILEKLCYISPD